MRDSLVSVRLIGSALALCAGQLCCAPAERPISRSTPVIQQQVDETRLVSLAGNVRAETRHAEADLGLVEDSFSAEHMLLQLQRSPDVELQFERYIESLQTPGSPNFHKWLTPDEIGEQFGPADADVAAVSRWLTSHGLRINSITPSRTVIDFSGTAGQLRATFHTEMHALNVRGERHVANASDPQIPAALLPVVVGVVSLHDFRPHTHVKARVTPDYNAGSGNQMLVPEDLATIYNLNPLFDAGVSGQGQTVMVVEDSDVFAPPVDAGAGTIPKDDWNTFRTTFGLSKYTAGTFTQIHPQPASGPSNCTPPGVGGAEGEAILDAEWASASAPSASIVLASCTDTLTFGGLLAMENVLNSPGEKPSVISMSYGECEANNGAASNAAFKSVYQLAVAEGVSVFVSTGDDGAAGCDYNGTYGGAGIAISGFASTPYNVAVGGTDFGDTYQRQGSNYWTGVNTATFGSARSYVPEIPWNGSCASTLLASYNSFSTAFGAHGYCNSSGPLTTGAGSGGPSGCATGSADIHTFLSDVGGGTESAVVSGSCRGYAKPSWQTVLGNPNDGVRDIPDVSLFSANGAWSHALIFCDSYSTIFSQQSCKGAPSTWPSAGGTSFASPIMAGIQALVNQKWGRQGNPNPTYYQIAATEYGTSGNAACDSSKGKAIGASCSFNDVTVGDITVNCQGPYDCYTPAGTNGVLSTTSAGDAPAFNAHAGWDFATGIGSVNAANLVNNSAWGAGQTNLSWTPPHR